MKNFFFCFSSLFFSLRLSFSFPFFVLFPYSFLFFFLTQTSLERNIIYIEENKEEEEEENTIQHYFEKKSKWFNEETRKDKSNIKRWIEFISFQDEISLGEGKNEIIQERNRRKFKEKKLEKGSQKDREKDFFFVSGVEKERNNQNKRKKKLKKRKEYKKKKRGKPKKNVR